MTNVAIHCCENIKYLIEDPESPLEYKPEIRQYILCNIPKKFLKKDEVSLAYEILYCPLCGSKFPKDLSEEWWNIMESKFNISGILDEKLENIPQEFKTEEWWKKRNL